MQRASKLLFRTDGARRRYLRVVLLETDTQIQDIARPLRVSASLVGKVMAGTRRHAGIERALARKAGRPVEELFAPRPSTKPSRARVCA